MVGIKFACPSSQCCPVLSPICPKFCLFVQSIKFIYVFFVFSSLRNYYIIFCITILPIGGPCHLFSISVLLRCTEKHNKMLLHLFVHVCSEFEISIPEYLLKQGNTNYATIHSFFICHAITPHVHFLPTGAIRIIATGRRCVSSLKITDLLTETTSIHAIQCVTLLSMRHYEMNTLSISLGK